MTLVELQDTYAISAGDAAASYFHRIYHSGVTLHGTGSTPSGTVNKTLWRVHSLYAVILEAATGRVIDGRTVRLLAQTSQKGSAAEVTLDCVQGSGFGVQARTPFICEYGIGIQVHAPMTAGEILRLIALIEVMP